MRRFDKLKVIKEANQSLEEKFLFGKSIISEQTDTGSPDVVTPTDSSTPAAVTPAADDSKKNKNNPAEDFNTFKKELSLRGSNTEASGNIPAGNGKKITIKSDGTYTIFSVDDEELQKGTFKGMGIWPAKHIELKPDTGKDFLKMKNILSGLDSDISSSTRSDFFTEFNSLLKQPKNLRRSGDGSYKYSFYQNKDKNITYSIFIYPESEGETGKFKMSWSDGKTSMWLTGGSGTFKDFGETFLLDNSKQVVSIDKNRKIDSGFIKLLSVLYPDYAG